MDYAINLQDILTPSYCINTIRISINVVPGSTFVCNLPATLYHVVELVSATDWYQRADPPLDDF